MRMKRLTNTAYVKPKTAKGCKKTLVRLVTLFVKGRDRSQEGKTKPTKVFAALEEGKKTIVDTECKRCVTEYQGGGVNPAGYPIGARTQRAVAVKAGKRLENSSNKQYTYSLANERNHKTSNTIPISAPATTEDAHA